MVKILHKIKSIESRKVDGQYCYIKVVLNKKAIQLQKETLECVMVEKQFDGSYWELFKKILLCRCECTQNTVDIIVGRDHAFKSQEKCV